MSIADDLDRRLDGWDTQPDADGPQPDAAPSRAAADAPTGGPGRRTAGEAEERTVRPALVAAAALLCTLGGAWMVGGLFRGGLLPRAVMAIGALIGVGLSYLSVRRPRGALLQAAVVPVAAVVGAVLVAPAASGGTANLPGLVGEALRSGGLLQPPVPFEPGWRFIGVVLFAGAGAAATGAAMATARPRLAVAVPVPLLIGGALLQSEGAALGAAAVGGLLAIASLALAYGADLPTSDAEPTRFEARRLARGGGLLVGLMVALVAVSQAGFLFPTPDQQQVVPPQKPPTPPPEPDRVLFTAQAPTPGPFRVGVLDEYDGEAFLLPPIDPSRIADVGDDGALHGEPGADLLRSTFTISDVRGATLPIPAGSEAVLADKDLEYDPRTDVVRLAGGRPPKGFTYTVAAAPPAGGKALAESPAPPPAIVEQFTAAPPAPNEVLTLLADAPANPFDRLQFIRQRLYGSVVAAGAGTPVDVPPARAAALLTDGAEATPYEITATEVLLARWAGVPARLGFGFFGGEEAGDGIREFRPRHGAAWLEAYFGDIGWVPLVGTPPRAKASLSETEKNEDDNVVATQQLALVVYVPIRLTTIELLYERVRYWASLILPVLALFALLAAAWPAAAKGLRRWRRERWAIERGPKARLWVAYAELRDRCHDLNVGDNRRPPLEFLADIDDDDEHTELAWLVTRAVWGDLQRDLRDEDAEAGEELAASVARRVAGAQTLVNRVLAHVSRASLRDPFAPEIPDLGLPRRLAVGRPTTAVPRRAGRLRRARHRIRTVVATPRTAVVALGLVVVLITVLVAPDRTRAGAQVPTVFPDTLVPAQSGAYEFVREESVEDSYAKPGAAALVSDGQVHSIRTGTVVAGSYQVAIFADDVDIRDPVIQSRVLSSILTGTWKHRPFGIVRLWELETAEQQAFLWFPPTTNTMQLFVFRADVADARRLVERVIADQLGLPPSTPGAGVSASGAATGAGTDVTEETAP